MKLHQVDHPLFPNGISPPSEVVIEKPQEIKQTVTVEQRKEIYELGKYQDFTDPIAYILTPTEDTLKVKLIFLLPS